MTKPVQRQRIVALGALSAMCKATLRLYAEEGARIVIAGRGEDRLKALATDLEARGAHQVVTWDTDLTGCADPRAELARMTSAIGGMDGVLLFYGTLGDNAKAEKDMSEARSILHTNFTSAAESSSARSPAIAAASRITSTVPQRAASVCSSRASLTASCAAAVTRSSSSRASSTRR